MDKRFRCGIIGLGHQAMEDHIPGVTESKYADLIAVSDIDAEKTEEVAQKLGIPGHTDYNEMLDSHDLDFIIATTSHDAYPSIVENVAKRKIHILKEKPLARNLEEARMMRSVCEENGVILTTAMQRRFNPIYTTFFQLRDRIGSPYLIDAVYTISVDDPHEGWRGYREISGGGCIIDMGYHMVDMIVWYFGLPDKVHADFTSNAREHECYDAEDTACVLFRYEPDLNGVLRLSRCYPPKRETISVVGNYGTIVIERGRIKMLDNAGEMVDCLTREDSWTAATSHQIDHFCRIINGERENEGSPDYHMQHLAFIGACYTSKEEGRYISPRELL